MRASIRIGAAALLIARAMQAGAAAPDGSQSVSRQAPPQGFEVRSEHFRVVTLGPRQAAAAAAASLERARSQFLALGFSLPASPIEVVLFRSAGELQLFLPGRSAGFFQPGADTSFLASAWGTPEEARGLIHELAHQALLPIAAGYPLWLREGLADLLSNLEPVAGGLKLGSPIATHLEALRRGPAGCEPTVQPVSDASLKAGPLFYPMSWLAAHRLVVGKPFSGNLAQRLRDLTPPQAPSDCERPDLLLAEILPVSLKPAGTGRDAGAAPVETSGPLRCGGCFLADTPAAVTARPLEAWEWDYHMAELLRALSRNDEARAALLALRERFPGRPEPAESLGALEMDLLLYDRAEGWFAEAVRLGSENPSTYYRYSLLLMRPGEGVEDAARYARRAVTLDPARPLYWLTRAQADMLLSQWEEAGASLDQMEARTEDPQLREEARIERAELERRREQELRPPPIEPAQPPVVIVTTRLPEAQPASAAPASELPAGAASSLARPSASPQSWPPAGTVLFMGRIQGVECRADAKILTVVNSRFSVRVRDRGARPARLYSAPPSMSRIPCSMKGVDVNVVYRPLGAFGQLNGDLVAVVF